MPKPSATDLRAWRAALWSDLDHWVGVVATRGERSWGRPALHAWFVPEHGEPVPVEVIESTA